MNRFVLIAAALLLAPHSAFGQTAPTYQGSDGQTKEAIGTFPVNGGAPRPTGTNADQVQGNVAAGANDVGNPIRTGGTVRVATSIYADGQRAPLALTLNGALQVGGFSTFGVDLASSQAIFLWGQDGNPRPLATLNYVSPSSGAAPVLMRGDAIGGVFTQEKERSQFFAEAPSILAAAAVFNGVTRDGAVSPSQWGSFSCFFRSDQASATNGAALQGSSDGTNWTVMQQTTLTAATPTRLIERNDMRYHRCMLTNGTTANTAAPVINSSFGN